MVGAQLDRLRINRRAPANCRHASAPPDECSRGDSGSPLGATPPGAFAVYDFGLHDGLPTGLTGTQLFGVLILRRRTKTTFRDPSTPPLSRPNTSRSEVSFTTSSRRPHRASPTARAPRTGALPSQLPDGQTTHLRHCLRQHGQPPGDLPPRQRGQYLAPNSHQSQFDLTKGYLLSSSLYIC